jgi:hypothetical protein
LEGAPENESVLVEVRKPLKKETLVGLGFPREETAIPIWVPQAGLELKTVSPNSNVRSLKSPELLIALTPQDKGQG